MPRTILIADDHPLFRQALMGALRAQLTDVTIVEANNLADVQEILQNQRMDLVLLDLKMPDSKGLAGLMLIKSQHPEIPVIVVSASEGASTIRSAIEAGASGYIVKSAAPEQMTKAINTVFDGDIYVPTGIDMSMVVDENDELSTIADLSLLTPTQLKVLVKMTEGLLNKQIAYEMDITEATVKSHVTAIFKKLKVRTRTQAVVLAKELEFVLAEDS